MDRALLESMTPDQRALVLARLEESMAALTETYLMALSVADEKRDWAADGATGLAAWLVQRSGMHQSTARRHVHVGKALAELPALRKALSAGDLCFDQVAEVTKFATPETDASWASDAQRFDASQLERIARWQKKKERVKDPREERTFRKRWDHEEGMLSFWGRLGLDEGAAFEAYLERRAEVLAREAEEAEEAAKPRDKLLADALAELASLGLASDQDADRACVVVHVTKDGAEIDAGPLVPEETLRRILCDFRLERVYESEGVPVSIDKAKRLVPAWLWRMVRFRDQGCRFPGCGRRRWTVAHHIVHRADGGLTIYVNVVQLCWSHHRLVHEGGWTIGGDPCDELFFVAPDQRLVRARAPSYAGSGQVEAQVGGEERELVGVQVDHPRHRPRAVADLLLTAQEDRAVR